MTPKNGWGKIEAIQIKSIQGVITSKYMATVTNSSQNVYVYVVWLLILLSSSLSPSSHLAQRSAKVSVYLDMHELPIKQPALNYVYNTEYTEFCCWIQTFTSHVENIQKKTPKRYWVEWRISVERESEYLFRDNASELVSLCIVNCIGIFILYIWYKPNDLA